MSSEACLVMRHDPSRVAPLQRSRPMTIGRDPANRLCLASSDGVAPHHAVVRHSRNHGWLVCDWGSGEGTWLEGQRIRQCRPLAHGDEIQLGRRGPVLVFRLHSPGSDGAEERAPAKPAAAVSAAGPARAAAPPLSLGGRTIALPDIRSVHVHSRPRHPHSFSWWVLLCLGGLLLLPWPLLFWPLQIGALVAWILLGSRKEHVLVITLRDGMAHRHCFASRMTALSHRNGLRKAIGQSLESG